MNVAMDYKDDFERGYDAGYAARYSDAEIKSYDRGYKACEFDRRQRVRQNNKLKLQRKRRRLYFLMQRMMGVFIIVLTCLIIKILEGDATIALFTVPVGLILLCSKKRYIADNYYIERIVENEYDV